MKLLYIHAKELNISTESKTRRRGNRLKSNAIRKFGDLLTPLNLDNQTIISKNSLLVLVCVENSDTNNDLDLEAIKNDILGARALLGTPEIVIGAFAHLSDKPAEAGVAKRITDELSTIIRNVWDSTRAYPFGWAKSMGFHAPNHNYNFSFRSFK